MARLSWLQEAYLSSKPGPSASVAAPSAPSPELGCPQVAKCRESSRLLPAAAAAAHNKKSQGPKQAGPGAAQQKYKLRFLKSLSSKDSEFLEKHILFLKSTWG